MSNVQEGVVDLKNLDSGLRSRKMKERGPRRWEEVARQIELLGIACSTVTTNRLWTSII